ncbi:unnamed protein product [Pelagomonas calceolata]|uniref:Uncharacterized protein n=1 Tax=Pelagomonas calceolata TaxID=35677 RepID=A0A8J2T303_9STRA|nr:unnamed protein product [Pelagomonas calceolata]
MSQRAVFREAMRVSSRRRRCKSEDLQSFTYRSTR